MSANEMEEQADGLWIIDSEARTTFANARMAEILGVDALQMMGGSSFDYLFPEDMQDAERLFAAKVQGDRLPFQFKLRRSDGSPVWVRVQSTPMHNAAGEFKGIVGTFTVFVPTDPVVSIAGKSEQQTARKPQHSQTRPK